jgi:hypothetical protein
MIVRNPPDLPPPPGDALLEYATAEIGVIAAGRDISSGLEQLGVGHPRFRANRTNSFVT